MTATELSRGSIYAAKLGPVLIVSNDLFNEVMPIVTIVPLTTRTAERRIYPSEVPLDKGTGGLRADSLALCHQVRTISSSRLGRRIGTIDDRSLAEVSKGLRIHLAL